MYEGSGVNIAYHTFLAAKYRNFVLWFHVCEIMIRSQSRMIGSPLLISNYHGFRSQR